VIVFAIRHKESGSFLCLGKHRAGTASVISGDRTPRIFRRRGAAVQALDWWVAGRYSSWIDSDGDFGDHITRKPERVLADMEVVELALVAT